MTGRERVLNTLAFRGSDRIPLDIWVLPAARLAHGKAFEELQARYADRVDIASFVGPFDHGFTPEYYEVGTYTDPWGSRWTNIQAGVVGEVKHPVFADYEAMKGYTPPTAQFLREWESNKPALEEKIAAARKPGNSSSAAGSACSSGSSSCGEPRTSTATSPWRSRRCSP